MGHLVASKGPKLGSPAGPRRANAMLGLTLRGDGGWRSSALAASHSTYQAANTAVGTAHLVVRVALRITLTSDESALHVPTWKVNGAA
jgi:hypothetical protein